MRCKKHLADFSSSIGVCASCLRERLFILVASSAQDDDRRKSDPPPLLFPHSVSPPYIRRQNSAWNHHHHHHYRQSLKDQLFFSTPQVGPTTTRAYDVNSPSREKTKTRFSLFSRFLFRSRAKKKMKKKTEDSDLNSVSSGRESTGSWFSNMLSGHRKKQSTAGFGRTIGRNRDRGLSPARVSDYGGDEVEWLDGSSGYSSASSQSWWQTPSRRAGTRRCGGGGRLSQSWSSNISGMAFFSSPLVRASPNRHWNSQKGVTPEMAFSGEIRFPVNLSTAAAFCANRSRKLADFGRSNHNH